MAKKKIKNNIMGKISDYLIKKQDEHEDEDPYMDYINNEVDAINNK